MVVPVAGTIRALVQMPKGVDAERENGARMRDAIKGAAEQIAYGTELAQMYAEVPVDTPRFAALQAGKKGIEKLALYHKQEAIAAAKELGFKKAYPEMKDLEGFAKTFTPNRLAQSYGQRSVAFGALARDLWIGAGLGAAVLAASLATLLPVDLGKAGQVLGKLSKLPVRIGLGIGAGALITGARVAAGAAKSNAKKAYEQFKLVEGMEMQDLLEAAPAAVRRLHTED